MLELTHDVVIAVLSGLVLAALGWLFTAVILPTIRDMVYQGVRLDGHWLNSFEADGKSYRFESQIRQKGRDLSGSTVVTREKSDVDYRTEMHLSGRIVEGFITITLLSKDPACLSLAAGVFKIEGRGARREGWLTYRTSQYDRAAAESATWTKMK